VQTQWKQRETVFETKIAQLVGLPVKQPVKE